MKKRYILFGMAAALLGVVVSGCATLLPNRQTSSLNLQTTEIQRGSLEAVVDATGVVYTNQTATIAWETSGIVEDVFVVVGDQVAAGQQLAALKRSSLPQSIFQAEQELIKAQQALEDLFDRAELSAAEAELKLAESREILEDAEYDWTLNQPGNRATPEELKSAKAKVTVAEKRLENHRKRLDKASGKVARAKAQIALTNAINQYQSAVWYLNWLQEGADETEMAIYEGKLRVAEAKFNLAQEDYEAVQDGPTAEDIALAEARVAAAQAAVDKVSLSAPFAGTVTDIDVKTGDLVSPGSKAFRIDDLQRMLVDVEVSEVDINQVSVGQEVSVRFDAIPDVVYNGHVVEIPTVGIENQGLVVFPVTVVLENPDPNVKSGMTAAASIVVDQVDNALLVPNRSVRWVNGKQVIYLVSGDEQSGQSLNLVQVELGASSDEYSELLTGDVDPGDVVALNPPAESEQTGIRPGQGMVNPNDQ